MYELASGTEVVSYFDQVMCQDFLPSGRVQYFPLCDYEGDGLAMLRRRITTMPQRLIAHAEG